MMWVVPAFLSAALLGLYDVSKKSSLRDNAVVPVLFLNTLFCSMVFLPLIVLSGCGVISPSDSLYMAAPTWEAHRFIFLKAVIVLSSWVLGYFAMKHLPLTTVGPINATRPLITLVGALLVFGERLNALQWGGVGLGMLSFWLMSRSGRREGIYFSHNRWIYLLVGAAFLGAASGLYDKFLMASPLAGGAGLGRMEVQGWYNLYQCAMMAVVAAVVARRQGEGEKFRWRWSILLISVFLTAADFLYFYALSCAGAMIAVVSMVRRGSVIVSFLCGALLLGERRNLRAKAFDLLLVMAGLVLLWLGSV